VVGSAPVSGQHTEEILTKLLNYGPEEISALEAEGAVYRSMVKEPAVTSA
jgi:crotonobetainyl-CoA:carnitine CoA-transferase CaiB-like acyl-CoA transferase